MKNIAFERNIVVGTKLTVVDGANWEFSEVVKVTDKQFTDKEGRRWKKSDGNEVGITGWYGKRVHIFETSDAEVYQDILATRELREKRYKISKVPFDYVPSEVVKQVYELLKPTIEKHNI